MTKSLKKIALGLFTSWVLSSLGAAVAGARPVLWQEEKQEERVRVETDPRVRIKKSPCVFVTTSHRRGMLGVQLTNLSPELRRHFGAPEDTGVMVSGITSGSPAEKVGLRVGDIITSIDGKEVSSSSDASRPIRRKEEGEIAEIEVLRDKKSLTFSAAIEERARSEVDLGDFFMEDCDELEFDFDEEAMREAIENATRHFRSPEWKSKWKWFEQWDEEELEEKLDEKLKNLEKKLEKMEKELERLELKKRKKSEEH
jgi:hypothetical protein